MIYEKQDKSPLTDLKSNELICKELNRLYPIMSEENSQTDYNKRNEYFCVDPIDGTKKNDEFTVNIAYMKNNGYSICTSSK